MIELQVVLLVSLAAAFMVLLLKKWGVVEWMQVHGDRFTSKLFSCDFCMSFWASVIVVLVVVCFIDEAWMLAVPVCSTPITRLLV